MKKLLAILLTLMLVLVNIAVLAAEEDPYKGKLDAVLELPKSFVATNGTAPAETFTFKFDPVSYTSPADLVAKKESTSTSADDIPAVANVSVSFSKGDTETDKAVEIVLPMENYVYGRYIYKATEVVPETKTAGVTYAENKEMYLVVTVFSNNDTDPTAKHWVAVLHEDSVGGKKEDRLFENTYDAGSLTVTKTLAGNFADLSDTFDFEIAFTAADDDTAISAAQKAEIGIDTDGTDGAWDEKTLTYTVTLGHENHITFTNIPAGTTYTVTETEKDGYEKTEDIGDETKTIDGGDEDTWDVTNTRQIEVDTGISMETVPYIMILALALIGAAVLFIRKREEY